MITLIGRGTEDGTAERSKDGWMDSVNLVGFRCFYRHTHSKDRPQLDRPTYTVTWTKKTTKSRISSKKQRKCWLSLDGSIPYDLFLLQLLPYDLVQRIIWFLSEECLHICMSVLTPLK
ncbi:hypothetical protein WUBG_04949 [Wuchereria bancrofti]|uniref:F-box domain-containing protein n=1 Tax=Wuchereria bancrofti TaxID=6293 RepID=J9BAL6_WUCBA|nr:hypothetical protein WUBG_04949 [Wuchereria bancrofti]